MNYFNVTSNNIKKEASSVSDEVFSIFLSINTSTDEMCIYDDIINAIKKYYKTSEFKDEYVDLMDELAQRIFKEPSVPRIGAVNNTKNIPKDRPNKFKEKYKI